MLLTVKPQMMAERTSRKRDISAVPGEADKNEPKRKRKKEKRKKENRQKVDLSVGGEKRSAGIKCAPLHSRNSLTGATPPSKQDATLHDGTFTPTSQKTLQSTSISLPQSRRLEESTHLLQHQNNPSNENETPGGLLDKVKSPRKALDFSSLVVERACSTVADTVFTPNHCGPDSPEVASGNCCREQQMENDALKNNMACTVTANFTEEVTKTCRPATGVLNPSMGAEHEIVEQEEGSNVSAKKRIDVPRERPNDASKIYRENNISHGLQLDNIASKRGFVISENKASGNCMFYALSEQLKHAKGIEVSCQDLRKTLVQYLKENPKLDNGAALNDFVVGYPSWSDYLRSMEKDGTWGDNLILVAAANYYQTNICVINNLDQETTIHPVSGSAVNTNPLVLGHIREEHYVSLLPQELTIRSDNPTNHRFLRVSVIGPESAGKTSLVKSLKGEAFNKEEPSTQVVVINSPIEIVRTKAWKNATYDQKTTPSDSMCADLIARDVKDIPAEQKCKQLLEPRMVGNGKATSTLGKKAILPKQTSMLAKISTFKEPNQITTLVQENSLDEIVWLVLWDCGGRAVYRDIQYLCMSLMTIYILVIDLTKNLSDSADSQLKVVSHNDGEVESPSSKDTIFDHILRWMSLIYSNICGSINPSSNTPLIKTEGQHRSVIMVGAKADMVGDPMRKMQSLRLSIARHFPERFLKYIAKESFVVDNTRAGETSDQEDPQFGSLWKKIIDLANEMLHTNKKIPVQWLSVEQEIISHPAPYVSKTKFRHEFAEKWCPMIEDKDLEELLYFLQSHGRIFYLPNYQDGLIVLDLKWLIGTIQEIVTTRPEWTYQLEHQSHYDNLENSGLLSGKLLDSACGRLNIDEIKDGLVFIMKKFSFLIELKNIYGNLIYLVPCKLKKLKEIDQNTGGGPAPLYLRFGEGKHVPSGLFVRLVVHFGEWVSTKCSAEQPDLYSNAASFFVDEKHTVHIVCHSSAIKLYFSTEDASGLVDTNSFSETILRQLGEIWTKLKIELPCLNSVCLNLCVRCELCPTSGSAPCVRHGEQECSHDDCAHYLDLNRQPLVCKKKRCQLPKDLKQKCRPWIGALQTVNSEEQPATILKEERKTRSAVSESEMMEPVEDSVSGSVNTASDISLVEIKEGEPDDELLDELAGEISKEWKILGRRLKVKDAVLYAIHKQEDQVHEKAYTMLQEWKQAQGKKANFLVLCNALCVPCVNRRDLAEEFCCVCHSQEHLQDFRPEARPQKDDAKSEETHQ